jgi:hypothetical protein
MIFTPTAPVRLEGSAGCGPDGPEHLGLVPGPLAPEGVAFHVLVQVLVRVQLRAVGREQEQPEPFRARGQPLLYGLRPMDPMAIHHEENRSAAVAEQAEDIARPPNCED